MFKCGKKLIKKNKGCLLQSYLYGLIPQVWVYSSQALAKPSGLPDLLFGQVGGRDREGVVKHLGVVENPDCLSVCRVSLLNTN